MLRLHNPGSDLGLSRGGRQISLEEERPAYNDRVSSRCRELKIHTKGQGGEQHCSIGNIRVATDYMADWICGCS
jgi:hypothetical protein